jgi:toxin ParE1/3/4
VTQAFFRPLAKQDQRHEVWYYRSHAGEATALRLVASLSAAIAQLCANPGIGSPMLGHELGIAGLRTWRVTGFPLVYLYIEASDRIDIVRLLGERQDIAAALFESS